ncbi:unnamed protein product, partial [Rotaria sordida]
MKSAARWSQWFREGREKVKDKERPERSVTETTVEIIEQVESIINDDPYVTIEELQTGTGLSCGTVHRIISDHLELKKVTARYIPKRLTDFQWAERVQIFKENLAKFQQEMWRLRDAVAGDES